MRASTDVSLALREEEEDETEQGERLGERDTEEHRRADRARHLGLAGHGRDGVADHEADADAGADGRGAVDDAGTDRLQTGLELAGLLGGEQGADEALLVSPSARGVGNRRCRRR